MSKPHYHCPKIGCLQQQFQSTSNIDKNNTYKLDSQRRILPHRPKTTFPAYYLDFDSPDSPPSRLRSNEIQSKQITSNPQQFRGWPKNKFVKTQLWWYLANKWIDFNKPVKFTSNKQRIPETS
ncbi:MAG: hypothetical protein Ta2E_12270 [Mycoplasmoidaceae bacterium]|nr:MAG: hypothetical protein Ta2E_12270 [Mycoplasmoidaceae bacterium]